MIKLPELKLKGENIVNNETVLGLSKGEKAFIIILPPIFGALIGWFLPTIAGWAIKIPFIPFEGPLEWISTTDNPWVPIIATIVGVLAGVIFALYVFDEILTVVVTDEEVKLNIKQKEKTIPKSEVSTVFIEGKELVIQGTDGSELFRGEHESKKELLSEAFQYNGYSWSETDPFLDQYQRWVADHPDFPSHVNALLAARERALEKDELEEATILRKDLADLSVVIRDKDKRQYVRMSRGEDK